MKAFQLQFSASSPQLFERGYNLFVLRCVYVILQLVCAAVHLCELTTSITSPTSEGISSLSTILFFFFRMWLTLCCVRRELRTLNSLVWKDIHMIWQGEWHKRLYELRMTVCVEVHLCDCTNCLCWGAILWSYNLYELKITVWVEVHLCDCTNCCVGVQYCDLTTSMSWGSQFVGLRCIYVIIQLVCVGVQYCDLTTCLSWGPQFGLWCIYVIVQLVCGKAHRCDSFVEMRESWIELISVSC